MAAADDDKELDESKKKKKGGSLKIIIIAVVVLVLLGGGAFAYLTFFAGGKPAEQAQETAAPADDIAAPAQSAKGAADAGTMYDFPVFVVNLADPTGSRYLRVSLSVEIPPKNVKLQAEMEQKLPKIKDTVITVLSSKTFEEITTPQGKISLKQELLRRINANLSSGRLMDVYITEFVVQ